MQNPLGRTHTVIERFLEERDSAEIGVREVNIVMRLTGTATRLAADETGPRPYHRVTPPHNVQSLSQVSNLGMRA